MAITNTNCINSADTGYGCIALDKIEYGCLQAVCPFFKTQEDFEKAEAKCKKRCHDLGIGFLTRDQVIAEMNKASQEQKSRYKKDKAKLVPSVIQYNSSDNEYIHYESIGEAAMKLDMSITKLELLIKKKEEYNGYRFVFA